MANRTSYLRYPPQQDPSEEILAALSLKKARADEAAALANHQIKQAKAEQMDAAAASAAPDPVQPQTQPPMQPQFPAQATQPQQDPRERELIRRLEQAGMAGQAAQGEDIAQLEQLAKAQADRGKLVQSDLSPTLNYLSQISGLDVARGYTAPESAAEQRKELYGLLKEKMAGRRALTDDQTALLKTLLGAHQAGNNDRQARFDQAQDTRAYQDVAKSYNKINDAASEFEKQHGQVMSALNEGTVFSVQRALSNIARLGGEKGVLTDQDITRVVPDNMKMRAAKALASLRSDPNYPVPEEVKAALVSGMTQLKDVFYEVQAKKLEKQRLAHSMGPGSYPKYGEAMYQSFIKGIPAATASDKSKAGAGAVLSPEEWLKAKKAKKAE